MKAAWVIALLALWGDGPVGGSPSIRLNQIGFYPDGPKMAVIVVGADTALRASVVDMTVRTGGAEIAGRSAETDAAAGPLFFITDTTLTDTVFTGHLGPLRYDGASGNITRLADFSTLTDTGTFVVTVPGLGRSYPFRIAQGVYAPLAAASVKAFYFQRASTPLPEAYAGKWARPEGHPDDQVLIHGSAADGDRPEGTIISSPGGWYDAGDYNKYIVNSGISMGTLLSLYEDFPEYTTALHTHIPEPDRGVPDLLEETLWNLRWMMTMQDPHDGGVYHKLTNAIFDPFVMPAQAIKPRYVVAKSTAASLDFAAVMAQAYRVYGRFGKALPGLADSCLSAALRAWTWAEAHPAVYYDQAALNRVYHPAIQTGTYGDNDVRDEFVWAGIELYLSTGQRRYYKETDTAALAPLSMPTWSNVRTLGYYSLLRFSGRLKPAATARLKTSADAATLAWLRRQLLSLADAWSQGLQTQGYNVVMGERTRDFSWGSNSVAANQGIGLIYAYRLTNDKKYLDLALSNLDYLLGRNATGYCFVTGMGARPPMHPHHRISEADGISDPIPGLLVGGPNPGRQDGQTYPSTRPAEAYTDQTPAYAANEIAINWNAPLAYLAGACEALQKAKLQKAK